MIHSSRKAMLFIESVKQQAIEIENLDSDDTFSHRLKKLAVERKRL